MALAQVTAPCIEAVVQEGAGSRAYSYQGINAGKSQGPFEGAQNVGAYAKTQIQHDEVGGDGHADADFVYQFHSDGLSVGHEGAVAQSHKDAGHKHFPASGGNGQKQKAHCQA